MKTCSNCRFVRGFTKLYCNNQDAVEALDFVRESDTCELWDGEEKGEVEEC